MKSKLIKIMLGLVGALVIAYLVLALLASPAPEHPFFTDLPSPLVIAHQGGDGLRPGDTLAAFENAMALSVDMLEMDLHQTVDGALVLMHDESVDRTTDGAGLIKEMTLAELKTLDAGYDWSPDDGQTFPYRGQGIQVPALDEVFEAFPGMRMNIEIKQASPPIYQAFCEKIREYNMQERVLVASFHEEAMVGFRQACPEVATSGSESEIRTFFILQTAFLGRLFSPDFHAVQVPEYSGGLHVLTPRFVRNAQNRNLQVHAWTINEPADMQRMIDMDVDGIITDFPDRLIATLDR